MKINKKDIAKSNINKKIEYVFRKFIDFITVFFVLIFLYPFVHPYIMHEEHNYFLDVGSESRSGSNIGIANLRPVPRISDVLNENDINYREFKSGLVYSNIELPINSKRVKISVRFKDNFPKHSAGFYIGVGDNKMWNYKYRPIYLPGFRMLENISHIVDGSMQLFFLKENSKKFFTIIDFIKNVPQDSIVATNIEMQIKTIQIEHYEKADYLLLDYLEPEKDDGWLVGTAIFDLKDLAHQKDKLDIIFNVKHLFDSSFLEYRVPVDWIKVSAYNYYYFINCK